MRISAWCVLGVLLAGCSDNPNQPMIIPGGGAAGGAIDGALFVHVIDQDSGAPLVGAAVQVGAATGGAPQAVVTDSTGLARIEGELLSGPQTVTASASGHVAATWYGASTTNLTIPLRPVDATAPQSAQIAGTIGGWTALPEPAAGHRTIAFISYTRHYPLDSPDNELPTPNRTVMIGNQTISIAGNACVRSALLTDCNFVLTTRPGKQAVYAIILDTDTKGTPAEGDDVNVVTGYALLRGLDVLAGQSLSGQTLTPIAATDIVNSAVNFGAPPTGMTARQAYSIVDLGDEGVLPTSQVTPAMPAAVLPKLVGSLAGARLDLIASADDAVAASSTLFVRALDPAGSINLTDWLPAPSQLQVTGATLSFARVAGAAVHTLEVVDQSGARQWSGAVLDESATLTLPTITPDPFAGTRRYTVSAVRAPGFDPHDFDVDAVQDLIRATSTTGAAFTR